MSAVMQVLFTTLCDPDTYAVTSLLLLETLVAAQIFITASATLRIQVAKNFRKLQAAVIGIQQADELEAASAREHPSFANVSEEAFPLFMSTR